MKQKRPGTASKYPNLLPTFQGFPYIWSRLVPCYFHLILLPETYPLTELTELARFQTVANKQPTCLVLARNHGIYYSSDGTGQPSQQIPAGGFVNSGKLRPAIELPLTEGLVRRSEALQAFQDSLKRDGYLMGNTTKGGRRATSEELQRFSGMPSTGGSPKGSGPMQCLR